MFKKEKNNPHSKLFNEKFINLSRLLQKVKKPTNHIFSFSSSAKKFCKLKAETVEKKGYFCTTKLVCFYIEAVPLSVGKNMEIVLFIFTCGY